MPNTIFRIDKFMVPEAHVVGFLATVEGTHAILRTCEGFLRDYVVRKVEGDGRFDIVTVVEWSDLESVESAKVIVGEAHRANGFAPPDYLRSLGAEADLGLYEYVAGANAG